jgi:hypothetical protein
VAKRYRGQNYPSVPQNRTYVPTRSTQKPPFYADIENASKWAPDAPEWQTFARDVVNMPETMVPAIQEAIRQQRWKIAPNPLASIRTAAHQEAKRMGLT